MGEVESQDLVKDGNVVMLGEAVLWPLALAFRGDIDKPMALRLVDSFGGCEMGETQGLSWEQRKLRKNFFSVLSPELLGDQREHKEQADTLAFFVSLFIISYRVQTSLRQKNGSLWCPR